MNLRKKCNRRNMVILYLFEATKKNKNNMSTMNQNLNKLRMPKLMHKNSFRSMLPQFYYKLGTPSNLSCIPIISNICSTTVSSQKTFSKWEAIWKYLQLITQALNIRPTSEKRLKLYCPTMSTKILYSNLILTLSRAILTRPSCRVRTNTICWWKLIAIRRATHSGFILRCKMDGQGKQWHLTYWTSVGI